jgi:hypothetical protein
LRKVIEKKYIRHGDEVFGYYGGLSLLNGLGLTTQMPNTLEIVTTKETSNLRYVKLRNSKVILRKARAEINNQNVAVLQLLDAFNEMGRPLDDEELDGIREFIGRSGINERDVMRYAGSFPLRAMKNLLSTGVENVFAQ